MDSLLVETRKTLREFSGKIAAIELQMKKGVITDTEYFAACLESIKWRDAALAQELLFWESTQANTAD